MGHLERAKYLIDEFHKMGNLYPVTTYSHAKKCAIVFAESIIKEMVTLEMNYDLDLAIEFKYWQEVLFWLKSDF